MLWWEWIMESKCGSKETCQEAVALRLMVAWTMVVPVEMIRIWIYSKVEPKQLSVGMKETESFEPVTKESYFLPPTYITHHLL